MQWTSELSALILKFYLSALCLLWLDDGNLTNFLVLIYLSLSRIFEQLPAWLFLPHYKKWWYSTVEALVTDTLVSGQLYLLPPSLNPVLLNSNTNSVFSHSCKRPAPGTNTFYAYWGCPLTRASIVYAWTWLPQPEVSEIPWLFPDCFLTNVKFPWPTPS